MGSIRGFRGGLRGVSRTVGMAGIVVLVAAGCGSKGAGHTAQTGDTLKLGASLSFSGATVREGVLTREGYDLCIDRVNAKGGVQVGDKKLKLDIDYQDDTSVPDTAGQIVDRFNDRGVKLLLGPYGTAPTGAAMPVVERNGQVMVDSAGATAAYRTPTWAWAELARGGERAAEHPVAIAVAPLLQRPQRRAQVPAQLGERILHARWDFRVDLAVHDAAGLQLPQVLGEHLLADPGQ
ncbi:ABC transporter substrate-binding protein [Nocardia seriolae]|nr:ABC transporter substrate-binding protein [Nocardia seriolae]MTK44751.1 ABC transporter substrate-binding protein [Nocardia seriolae]